MNFFKLVVLILALFTEHPVEAKVQKFIAYSQPEIAFRNVTVIDGTGTAAKNRQTVVIKDGIITAYGPGSTVPIPKSATVIDGTGKTLIPGLVLMHEHMFYPTGLSHYTEMLHSFPKLYIAGGATTIRTAGTTSPYADLNLRQAIQKNEVFGPTIDVTAPYLNGPGLPILKIKKLKGAYDAKRMVGYWADEGATSYKAYMHIHQDELTEVIREAHQRKHHVTAHLCSVTYREAALLGIDNLEHGFFVASDFVKGKKKDKCPSSKEIAKSLHELDLNSPQLRELFQLLVKKNVAITSTLTVFESFTPGRPKASEQALSVLTPQLRKQYESGWNRIAKSKSSHWSKLFKRGMELEKLFVEAGGTLIVGTDPTGYGGVIAGFASKRAIELLVETGFSMEQAIQFATLNGAKFLGVDQLKGSITVGKEADLVLIDGDPTIKTASIRNMEFVFQDGIGYDSQKIIESLRETVGLH